MSSTIDESLNIDFRAASYQHAPARYSYAWVAALVMLDLAAFFVTSYVAGGLVDHEWDFSNFEGRLLHSSLIFILLWVVVFERLGLYRRSFALSTKDEFYYTVVALSLGILPQLIIFTIVPAISTSRLLLAVSLGVGVVIVGGERAAVHAVRSFIRAHRRQRLLMIGSGRNAECVAQAMEAHPENVFRWPDAARWLDAAKLHRCTTVVWTETIEPAELSEMLAVASRNGIHVALAFPQLQCQAYDFEAQRSGHQLLLIPKQLPVCMPVGRLTKRLLDLIGATVGLIVLWPVLALAALAIFIESGAPVIFSQERIGKDGVPFRVLKFRTMRPDAGLDWAKPGDARITRVGAFLRRTSIDELPQLINILRGEMSIVGPRPEMRKFAEYFTLRLPRYAERHLVKPGITGWAQVSMKRNLEPADASRVLAYDLFYIEHWSLYLDIAVVFKTAIEFLFHRAV